MVFLEVEIRKFSALRALDFKAQTTKIYTKVQVLYMLQNCLITKKISYALGLNQQHLS